MQMQAALLARMQGCSNASIIGLDGRSCHAFQSTRASLATKACTDYSLDAITLIEGNDIVCLGTYMCDRYVVNSREDISNKSERK